jgi:hypothetical protein
MFPFVSVGSIVRNFVRAGLAPAELKHQRARPRATMHERAKATSISPDRNPSETLRRA